MLITACADRKAPEPSDVDPYLDAPLHLSHDITVKFYDSADVRAVLDAGIAYVYENRKETSMGGGVKVVFFDRRTGMAAATLTSDSAIIDDRSRDMVAIGNVVVISDSSQTTLNTEQLIWDQETEKIKTDEDVVIRTPTEVIEGTGLVSDQYLTAYRIFKVRGIHQP